MNQTLDPLRLRLTREVADTRQRLALGGLFYLAGWAVVSSVAPVYPRHALAGVGISLGFLLLAALRVLLRAPRVDQPPERQQRWLDLQWAVMFSTAGLWGVVLGWTLLDPAFEPARTPALLCSIAFATAYAHNFTTRPARSFASIALLYLPAPLLLARSPDDRAVAVTLGVYFFYVLLTLMRTHREYQRRLDVDDQLWQQRDQYEQLSRTDALTGLSNRRHFRARLDDLVAQSRRTGEALSLLVLDLDHFKRVNDQYGHEAGDACLARFAARMNECLDEPGAHLARLGGEEFAVLLPGTSPQQAAARAQKLRESLAQDVIVLAEGRLQITVSIGVAGLDPATKEGADLFREADRALYLAKAEGRDRVCIAGG
ncbi:MAG: GGDEF domain-containing protein [Lysobacteraceae bacterium]|nr:MAG: GGDEF domain-containing protein [Xanthomonadaceae bacterium]